MYEFGLLMSGRARYTMMYYPAWQWRFWLRSVVVPRGDFVYTARGRLWLLSLGELRESD